jgi:hypothetical protein
MSAAVVPWTCPTCNAVVATAFCARCGEEPVSARDLTLRGLAARLLHALTSIDARAVRTTRCLLRHPGELTLSWVRGIRKPYVAPFQLFLLANVTFFGLQWLTGNASPRAAGPPATAPVRSSPGGAGVTLYAT